MAKKISQLTQATEVKSDDVTVIVQDGETKKLPLNMMVTKQDVENKKIAGLAKLDEIEATYENDTYTPTITVKNKSSVKTGEGDEVDYSANVMDGHVKSAILTGNTLVNNLVKCTDIPITNSTHSGHINFSKNIEVGKEYTIIISISNAVASTDSKIINIRGNNVDGTYKSICGGVFKVTNGIQKVKFTSTDNFKTCLISFANTTPENSSMIIDYLMFIEGDHTNIDIPYFTGMQSVKLPVLTTTGKNLFPNIKFIHNRALQQGSGNIANVTTDDWACEDYLNVPQQKTLYTNMLYIGLTWTKICFYDENKKFISSRMSNDTVIFPENSKYWRVGAFVTPENSHLLNQIMLCDSMEEARSAYEPYKSNILTTPQDVVLRGIGDVKDELDLVSGELTQRIGEIVLDGRESWILTSDENNLTIRFALSLPLSKPTNIICEQFKVEHTYGKEYECIQLTDNKVLVVRISKEKATTLEMLKQWLSQNPITVQYELATPTVKTVDLIPSGTHPSTTPYCWKDGYIQLSSSGLLPNLEYSVVTSRAGQISQNAAMIVKNDKRIFDLEILLAGGLVNTTYQALTLQNQVETGLSKVSLSSEKEPDYLLYHMIMKLIEEKAYKLDDLAEKVSVFYLYEKLSDEQFETIYSELYPFVEEEYIELPEDGEIVEEPIVDEVLEEVENGVVM